MVATAASAQSTNSPIQLDTVTVQGEGGSGTGPVNGYVASKTTTGSKSSTPIQEVPQSVSVIGRDELDDRQPQKLDEALRYTPGVLAQPFGFDSRTDWFYIRGFDATQTGVYLNGTQLYQYAFGGFKIDPFALERVEVLKGPSSVLYGGSSTGGLLNLVTKMPTQTPLHLLETGINSWGNGYGAFDFSGPVDQSGQWLYRLTGKLAGGGYETDKARGFNGFIAPSLTYKPSDTTSVTLYGQYRHDDTDHTGGFLPYYGTVKPASFGRISRDFYYDESSIDTYKRSQALLGYQFEHQVNDTWTLRQNVRYAYLDISEYGPYPYGYVGSDGYPTDKPATPDNLLYRINFKQHTIVHTATADNQAEAKFDTGPLAHTLLLGFDYKFYNINQKQGSGSGSSLSASNPVYGTPQSATSLYLDQNYTMHQLGAYIQDQIKFGNGWIATLNGRYDRLWTNSVDKVGAANFNYDDGAFSGRAGLAYEFSNGVTPYVAISRSFNPQIGATATGQPFKPETADQYEAGIKYKPTFFDGLITASYFDLTRQNYLATDPSNIFFQKPIGEVRVRGAELEAKANVTDALKLTAAFTAYHMFITKNPADRSLIGKRPYGIPDVQASLWADYTFQSGMLQNLGIAGGIRYQGSSYADAANTLKVPDATLFDAGIHYEYKQWKVALNVNNIFDKRYVSSCQTVYNCSYGEGRTATLKASYKW